MENQVIAKEKRKDVKKDEKPPLQQKYGRNIGSNIIHLIFRFIKQEEKMRKKIEAVIERDQMTIKTEEFYLMLQKEEDKLEVYIPTKKMRRLWRGPQGIVQHVGRKRREAEFSKILRILGKYYLMNYHLPYAYNSNKIKQASKRLHSQEIRRILAFWFFPFIFQQNSRRNLAYPVFQKNSLKGWFLILLALFWGGGVNLI